MKLVSVWVILTLFFNQVGAQCTPKSYTFNDSTNTPDFKVDYNMDNAVIKDGSMHLNLDRSGGTRITLADKIQYGTIHARFKIARGSNVVSSFILMADNGDEIDFEAVGKDTNVLQTNYYYRGIPLYDVNAKYFKTTRDLSANTNTYTIHWTPEYYEWLYNGYSLRKLSKNSTAKYPDSPSHIQFGIWAAPPSRWAGPGISWNVTAYTFSIEHIQITCNSTINTKTIPRTTTTTTNGTTATNNATPTNNTTSSSTTDSRDLPISESINSESKSNSKSTGLLLGLISLFFVLL